MTNLETLKQQTADMEVKLKEMKAEIERLENGWEMKCPYKVGDNYWVFYDDGSFEIDDWCDYEIDIDRFKSGNTFPTEEAAELEAKRRNLLTRFRAFRDECNDGWKPDWSNGDKKWDIDYTEEGVKALWTSGVNSFSTFGYFKNKQDTERAIELFGDEIKELFVDGEV